MRSLRVDIMLPFALPDDGTEMDAAKAFAELPLAVRTRALALRNAIRDAVADARPLGLMEPVKATMHVCTHGPDGALTGCGPVVVIK